MSDGSGFAPSAWRYGHRTWPGALVAPRTRVKASAAGWSAFTRHIAFFKAIIAGRKALGALIDRLACSGHNGA